MPVDANTGNAFLDSYAHQINSLEKDPNATPEYDAGLEKQFAAVKAQILGNGGPTPDTGNGGPTTTHGTGSGSHTGSTGSNGAPGGHTGSTGSHGAPGSPPTGSSNGAPPPPVADSIGQIKATAGPGAAATVQKIVDGGAATIGGSAGATVGASAAQAGAHAAQHVIDNGGTPAQAAMAAETKAQAVITAGEAGGPAAAANVATIDDPAKAKSVADTAQRASEAAGGGATGSAIADAVTRAGAAGGPAAAEAAADAAQAGGPAAANAVADAAVSASTMAGGGAAGEAAATTAAQATSDAARYAFQHAGGGEAGAEAAVTTAQAAADATKVGGPAAAEAVSTAARAGGAPAATAVSEAAQQAAAVTSDPGEIAQVAQSTADVIQAVMNSGGDVGDAITVANSSARAFSSMIAGGASASDVAGYAKHILDLVKAGKTPDEITQVIDQFEAQARAFAVGGQAAADAVESAIENAIKRGESPADITATAQAVADSAQNAFQHAKSAKEAPKAAVTAAETAADASIRGGAPAAEIGADVYAAGGTTAEANGAADFVTAAAQAGGPDVARDVYRNAHIVTEAGGTGQQVVDAAQASFRAYANGGNGALDGVFDAGEAVSSVRGNAGDILRAQLSVTEGTELARLEGASPDQAGAVGHEIGQFARNAAGAAGANANEVVDAVTNFAPRAWAPPAFQPNTSPPPYAPPSSPPPPYTGAPPERTTVVATADGEPFPLNPVGPADNAYAKLLNDLQSGADKGTIQKDAQQLAIVAAGVNDGSLEKVALLVGSGMYGSSAADILKGASPELADRDNVYGPKVTDPLDGLHSPLNDAYLQLEVDIAGGADQQTIKADADIVAKLAGDAGQSPLALAASNISNSITDGSYNQGGSLTALMNTATALPPGSPPPPAPGQPVPPAPPDNLAYQKLMSDIKSGADTVTIITDAAQLSIAAAKNGDKNLEDVARYIGMSINNGFYSADWAQSLLKGADPLTPGAKSPQGQTGAPAQPNETGTAYLKLASDIEHGADQQIVRDDAEAVKAALANERPGENPGLGSAADAIIQEIDNHTYDQLGAEEAMMNDGADNVELGLAPDESTAYQKLLTDIRSGADGATINHDVVMLSDAAIRNNDFGLGQTALDIGESVKNGDGKYVKDGKFDSASAEKDLTNAAPGTSAAKLPTITETAA